MRALSYIFVCVICMTLFLMVEGVLDTSATVRARRRRAVLVYQPGLNWVQIVMGIGLPIEIQDNSITMGAVVKSYYELPNNVTYYTNPSIDIDQKRRRRRRQAINAPSRWEIYNAIQDFIKSFGYADGKSCLLNAVCETSRHPFDASGLLAELLHLFLTPSTTRESVAQPFDRDFHAAERAGRTACVDCQQAYPCEDNLLRKFTQLVSIT